jgi:ferredoxin
MSSEIPRRRLLLVGCVVSLLFLAAGYLLQRHAGAGPTKIPTISGSQSIKQVAQELGHTPKSIARELGLRLEVSKQRPLTELGVSQKQIDHAVEHILSHRPSHWKYALYAIISLWGTLWLVGLGRPGGDRKLWYPRWPYRLALLSAIIACGFLTGKSPNPMEGAVKVFKSLAGLYPTFVPYLLALAFFLVLTVIANKVVCGWACPFGAMQELAWEATPLKRKHRHKIPFWMTNLIRALLFVIMLTVLFGLVGGRPGFVLYHFVNPFNLFNLDIEYLSITLTLLLSILGGLAFYRPFCQLVCPFGLLSWAFEQVSLYRVRVDEQACTNCGACSKLCPTHAARDALAGKAIRADCFSCARCLNCCPENALRYSRH